MKKKYVNKFGELTSQDIENMMINILLSKCTYIVDAQYKNQINKTYFDEFNGDSKAPNVIYVSSEDVALELIGSDG